MNNKWNCITVLILISLFISSCSAAKKPAAQTEAPVKPVVTTISTETTKPTDVPQPTITIQPTVEPTPTIVPTSESVEMEKLIKKLADDKIISTTQGTYKKLADFDESWAQLYWYQWWYTDFSPTNFVIQADLEWQSGSNIANWSDSGCGFIYHESGSKNHHATFLMMDGKVVSYRAINDTWTSLKGGNAGRFKTPADSAHMVLVVDNQWVTALVNGNKVVRFQDTKLTGGKLALTVASGTNKDFGTRCQMKNIELWVLPD